MRNTVFKTAALAGLFSCVLAFAGAFSGVTTSVHAITASEVDTEAELEQFVKEAVDAYYIDLIIRMCDFSENPTITTGLETIGLDLATATADEIRPRIRLFSEVGINSRSGLADYCDLSQRFDEVFGREEGDWKSGSIYLFVMDDDGTLLYHGADQSLEEERLVAVDEGGRNVRELIVDGAEDSGNAGTVVKYCWDDPATDDDNIDDEDSTTAPGDSLKASYVVDPFEYYEAPALSASPGVIFGSAIYPGMDSEYPACDGNGMADYVADDMGGDDDMGGGDDDMGSGDDDMGSGGSVSGGGCAIAAGSDNAPRSNALNLLLIVSALFLAVSFGNRAVGRRNDIRS